MAHPTDTERLRSTIGALLKTPSAGRAVSRHLAADRDAWADRALIADLRARRARHVYDAAVSDRDSARAASPGPAGPPARRLS